MDRFSMAMHRNTWKRASVVQSRVRRKDLRYVLPKRNRAPCDQELQAVLDSVLEYQKTGSRPANANKVLAALDGCYDEHRKTSSTPDLKYYLYRCAKEENAKFRGKKQTIPKQYQA